MIDSSKFVFEKTDTGFSAYSPQYLGVGVAANTRDEAERMLYEAIAFHLEDDEAEVSVPTFEFSGFDFSGILRVQVASQVYATGMTIAGPGAYISSAPFLVEHAA